MSTETLTLTEFLLERITEDEAESRVQTWGQPVPRDCWEPERVRAECEAKRQLVAGFAEREHVGHPADVTADYYHQGLTSAHDRTMRVLAAVYADHPDYLNDWRP